MQVFEGVDLAPVVVLTQRVGEGAPLEAWAEEFATAVWAEFLPELAGQPVWLLVVDTATAERKVYAAPVTFTIGEGRTLIKGVFAGQLTAGPAWEFVGCEVDLDRGEGYVADPEEPVEDDRYAITWVALLPRPEPFRAPECMPSGITWRRRLVRQIRPDRTPRSCCQYHEGDWARASRIAARAVRQGHRKGLSNGEIRAHAASLAVPFGSTTQDEVDALLNPDAIFISDGYGNGQHRAQAMLDQGVRRTVVARPPWKRWRDRLRSGS